jgi:3-hydroxyacyl-CoA dehydrogenase
MPVTSVDHAAVRVLRLEHPPVNALSVRGGLVSQLTALVKAAVADGTVRGLVIAGSGRNFCAGADIADFDGDPAALDQIRSVLDCGGGEQRTERSEPLTPSKPALWR